MQAKKPDGTRLVTRVLRDVLGAAGRFETYSDLLAALRRRLTALRIPFRQHELDDAVSLVATNREIVVPPPPPPPTRPPTIDPPAIGRAEAIALLADINARLSTRAAPKTVPETSAAEDAAAHEALVRAQAKLEEALASHRARRERPAFEDRLATIFEPPREAGEDGE